MRLLIENKQKQETFIAIFQLLKNWSNVINMNFENDKLYIQAMDKSHVCLADINITDDWFEHYDCQTNNKICVDSTHFAILMNYGLNNGTIELKFEDESEPEKLFINFLNNKNAVSNDDNVKPADKKKSVKGSFDHYFELNLIDNEEDGLVIPEVDYDVDFVIDSKKFVDVLSELNTFGQKLNIVCNENVVDLNASGDSAKLKVSIKTDELEEYAIGEDSTLDVSFSLTHVCKMCCSLKLSKMMSISLSQEYPMALKYDLGEKSNVIFYVAPQMIDA